MKSTHSIVLFLSLFLIGASCSVAVEKSQDTKERSGRNSNSAPSNTTANSATLASPSSPGVATGSPVPDNPIADTKKSRMEALRKGVAGSTANIDLEAELKKSMRPAPENSEFGAVLTDFVFERRTFKSHPQLVKLEKITRGENKTIKIYLKDGKIVEVPGNTIDFIATANTVSILQAAGIGSPGSTRKSASKPE